MRSAQIILTLLRIEDYLSSVYEVNFGLRSASERPVGQPENSFCLAKARSATAFY